MIWIHLEKESRSFWRMGVEIGGVRHEKKKEAKGNVLEFA